MRIAIVTPTVDRSGGTEKCMSWLVEDLSQTCDVTLFAGKVGDTDVARTRVVLVPMLRHPRLLRFVTFAVVSPIALALSRARRARRARGRAFDVVLATSGDCIAADAVYAHFCCAAWSAVIGRGEVTFPSGTLWRRVRNFHYSLFLRVAAIAERLMYRASDPGPVFAVSAGVKREILGHYGVAPDRVRVVPNAVDERVRLSPDIRARHRRAVRAEHGIPGDALVTLFAAAGDWKRKNLEIVLGALAELVDVPVHLMVLGQEDGSLYRERAGQLGVSERVTFCGFRRDIERYYAAADLFVYPSSYEAFSLVSLEAAGAGLPLLVTRINGTEELVDDGVSGFFVEADASDISAKIRRFLADPDLLQRMSAAAAAAAERYSRLNVSAQILATLRNHAGRSRSPHAMHRA